MKEDMQLLSAATSLFVFLVITGLVVAVIAVMVAPSVGREMLKTIGIAAVLFISGSLLLQAFHFAGGQTAGLAGLLSRLIGLVAAIALLVCAFLYPFDQKEALSLLKRVGLALAGLLFLPVALIELARALNPAVLGAALVIVPLAAYCLHEYRKEQPKPRERPNRPERTPSLPRGGARL